MEKCKLIMAVSMVLALCIQRIYLAVGSVFWGIAILCFLMLSYQSYKNGDLKQRFNKYKKYYYMIFFMWIIFLISCLVNGDFKVSLHEFFNTWVYHLLPFFMITLFLQDKKYLKYMIVALLLNVVAECLVSCYQGLVLNVNRTYGYSGNSLIFASLLTAIVPVLYISLLDEKIDLKMRKFIIIVFLCVIAELFFSKSRGSWLVSAIVLSTISVNYMLRSRKSLAICLAVFSIIFGVFYVNPAYVARFKTITNTTTNNSNRARIELWNSSYEMIKDNPVAGVGIGRWYKVYIEKDYVTVFNKKKKFHLPHTHNNVLQITAEAGIFGGLAFLLLPIYTIMTCLKTYVKNSNPYALMILSMWIAYMFIGVFDTLFQHFYVSKNLWTVFAMLLYFKCEYDKMYEINN